MKKIFAAIALSATALTATATPIMTDIVAIVDESGSMGGEHAWLPGMINALDSELAAAAGTDPFSAQYGLVGMGGNGAHQSAHQHDVNGGQFGNASQFGTATSSLITSGYLEDGYDGIDLALNDYSLRAGALTNLILVTDEDRDVADSSLNYTNILNSLNQRGALLNAVVNVNFYCGDGSVALGMDHEGFGYQADGSGGFIKCADAYEGSGFGTSIADYVTLAFATGGAAWDLNQLRAGGLTATSFTNAFVDIKVEETITNVSEPSTLAVFGLMLCALGFASRRKA